jgi:hypothetical protein
MMRAAMILALGARLAMTADVAAQTLTARASLPMPDYSGVWKLNRELSDDPAQAMKEMRGSGRSGPSGGWHGHGRGGGRHGGGGSPGEGGSDSAASESPAFAALETLTIRHSEPEITVVDAVGHEHRMTTDGKKVEEERSHGGTTKVAAAWKEGHLEVVSVPERGPRWTETYSITADRSQLTVTTKIDGSRGGTATIRRVYDAAPADAPEAPSSQPSVVEDESVSAR